MDQETYNTLPPEEKVEALKVLAAGAEAAGTDKCIKGEAVFFAEDSEARLPGHIYSRDGAREFRISTCCEFHFDGWFKDEEEPPEPHLCGLEACEIAGECQARSDCRYQEEDGV